MTIRPVDSGGDILPVANSADMATSTEAAAAGLRNHLNLFTGEWWEYPEKGNPVFDLISVSRRSDQDAAALSSAITAYILKFPAIQSLSDVQSSFAGRVFSFSCTAHTETGETFAVNFSSP